MVTIELHKLNLSSDTLCRYDNNVQIIDGKSSSSSGLSAGAIAGVVIGAAVAIAAVLAIVLYMTRKRRKSNKDQLSKGTAGLIL